MGKEVRRVRLRDGQIIDVETNPDQEMIRFGWVWKATTKVVGLESETVEDVTFDADGSWSVCRSESRYDIVEWDVVVAAPAPRDEVNHPSHYTAHPSGVECIDITEHMPANVANVFKYLWRSGLKDGPEGQDYNKAVWFLLREMRRLGVKLTVNADVVEALR